MGQAREVAGAGRPAERELPALQGRRADTAPDPLVDEAIGEAPAEDRRGRRAARRNPGDRACHPRPGDDLRSQGPLVRPRPEPAQDLEKLREAALHKEFETYKQIGSKKLKVFRLEAVRAGFGKAWREKDYDTIIEVAKKIPETVLQEDPKLLMYYDNALDRMEGSSTEGCYYSSNTRSEVEMARTTRVISVSVPEKLAEEIEDMAREEGISKSELFRLMARAYKRSQAGERLARLQKELGPGLRAAGLRTEEDVDRFVFEDR
jgi:hypothetical protein